MTDSKKILVNCEGVSFQDLIIPITVSFVRCDLFKDRDEKKILKAIRRLGMNENEEEYTNMLKKEKRQS